mmetsp:Transcript_16509/g.16445  ORF Transcript_16509/g.16445 Transcript_16509/m.16445 type:complete len:358 (-) Transcript_16509:38-1111(-)
MDDESFDGLFMQCVQTKRGIDGFLNCFYGFLRRRTDFFTTPTEAKQELLDHFEANLLYFNKAKEYIQKKQEEKKKRDEELRIKEEKRQEELRKAEEERKAEELRQAEEARIIEESKSEEQKSLETQLSQNKIVEVTDEQAAMLTEPKQEEVKSPPKKKLVPKLTQNQLPAGSTPPVEEKKGESKGLMPINNGGKTDRYFWTQQLNDITINFYIPENFQAKHIKVNLRPDHITIIHKGQVFLDGDFFDGIKPDDPLWMVDTVEGRKCIVLTLDKVAVRTWWKCALKGEPEIDTTKVDPGNTNLSIFDEETRPVIEKGLLDAQRKEMGLPTFDEEKNQQILREALAKNPELAKKFAAGP